MEAKVRWTHGMSFLAVSGTSHAVVMDTSADNGGGGTGPSPMEMVLMGLAGCSGMDVVSILKKKRVHWQGFCIDVQAERAPDHPKVFSDIAVNFIFHGPDLKRKPLEDAVRLSMEKYCSVAGMLQTTAQINWSVTIEDSAP